MKPRSLTIMSVIFGCCLIIFACRKEINNALHNRSEPPSVMLEAAKIWYLQHVSTETSKQNGRLSPHWNDTWTVETTDNKTLMIVPASEHYVKDRSFNIRRFFIFTPDGRTIGDGRIVEFVGRNYNVDEDIDSLIKNYNQASIPGFSGSILQYDVNYSPLANSAYLQGYKQTDPNKVALFRSQRGKPPAETSVVMAKSCTPVFISYVNFPLNIKPECTYTFWEEVTTNSDGCVTSHTRTFISESCPNSGSGSGGSGSGSGSGSSNPDPPYGGGGQQQTPCQQAAALTTNAPFQASFTTLRNSTNLNFESGYIMQVNSTYTAIVGNANQPQIDVQVTAPINGFLHTHLVGHMPIFSGSDIKAINQLRVGGKIADINTFTMGVVTAAGTAYIIKVADPAQFTTFGTANFTTQAQFNAFEVSYQNNITVYSALSGTIAGHEKALLKVLESAGLQIFKGNNGFTEWKRLTLNQPTPSNMVTHTISETNCTVH
ncbi:hypothetical protein [Chitinophaga ginsengisegetis]|uniref:hypothetical protein n=1 Tax=Chitinophaga ginsengisegetis TaxID=393003 RepID=UPI000DB925D2|nr:hypothetical protein [Chitinophaga ginsengisegetis]MDR6570728.1 putative membrane protein YgcG [Chitinophaga ginsengisegetis]MDR6650462.1 putative membrane protein YgcG [Chitinophaga ginsengisegetis]MDR6656899.1 putative membrane protein YgcG [Chitinophaga ginsengisegetis]